MFCFFLFDQRKHINTYNCVLFLQRLSDNLFCQLFVNFCRPRRTPTEVRLFRGDDGGLIKRAQVTRLNGTKGGRVRFEKQTKYNTLITRVRYTLYGQTCAYEWVS